jgi:hypothetical protein
MIIRSLWNSELKMAVLFSSEEDTLFISLRADFLQQYQIEHAPLNHNEPWD